MAKRVFFCFHYEDVESFRANVVRNHWVTKRTARMLGFLMLPFGKKPKIEEAPPP